MEKITVDEIRKAVGGELCGISPEKEITAVSSDTRKIEAGCLFIAIKGERFDGHDFAASAIEQGAAAVLSEKKLDGIPSIVCESTRKALLDLSGYYRRTLPVKVVGITGSVGKTTTKELTALAVSSAFNTLKTEGNLNNEIGLPTTLFRLDNSFEAAVIEMGMSGFGEIERLSKAANPDVCLITNIGLCHLEQLGSQDNILKAKLEIISGAKPSAPLIVNGDDERLFPLTRSVTDRKVITFGIDNKDCDYVADNIVQEEEKLRFDIVTDGKAIPCELPCIGKHYALDALAAVAAAVALGADIEKAAAALASYVPAGMRQKIEKIGGFTAVIDCYNASPTSMKASIDALCDMKCTGRRGAVLADMLELGERSPELHTDIGRYAAEKKLDYIACYGKMSKYIAAAADEAGLHSSSTDDPAMLVEWLKAKISDGDTVLFKGSRGMKLEKIIDELRKG